MLKILLLCALAYGEDSVAIEKGEKAPFSGTLLSPVGVAQIIAKADEEVGKCKIDAERDLAIADADFKLQLKIKEADLTACLEKSSGLEALRAEQIDFLEKQVYKPRWTNTAVYVSGIVSGIGIVYLTSKVIQ
jgi:hypothetical protein